MTKHRVEAFSDGVFAISITLLVLNIRIPGAEVHDNAQLIRALRDALPNVLTFVFSFLVIGVFWVAHHRIFNFVKEVNHVILWSNIGYLLTVALMPFPAAILAQHPFLPAAIMLYCLLLFLCASQHLIFLLYMRGHPEIAEKSFTKARFRQFLYLAIVGPVCYIGAAFLSLVNPIISFCLILLALIFYIIIVQYLTVIRRSPLPDNRH
jgi:uncharacterized membrane protein